MAISKEEIEQTRADEKLKAAHQRMERELYGEPPESPGTKRTRKEFGLKNETMLGLYAKEKDVPRKIKNVITGEDDYGTSLSKGAMQAADKAAKDYRGEYSGAGKTRGQVDLEAMGVARKAAREAASEERREARGMKKGGKVSSASARADGCAIRGKTKGRMV